ncbi:Por secretion system C-terminal sorting domain-containing protein [Spirosomataceae bacterium TFI 002]|nr:Por secretion system C-terminal sorting domain-containing protein [Spirosomataceae bacterium TFI 002]
MRRIIYFVVCFLVMSFSSFSQGDCINNPTSTINSVSSAGGICTYNITLTIRINKQATKWIRFVVNGVTYCYYHDGTWMQDLTCTTTAGFDNSNAGDIVSFTTNVVIPCTSELTASYEGGTGGNYTNGSCFNGTYTMNTAPFPVSIRQFSARSLESAVHLSWNVEDEINFKRYEIQKSNDALSFETFEIVKAQSLNQYETHDFDPQIGQNYYRLRLIDIDGTVSFSKIISQKFYGEEDITLYPNPSTNQLYYLSGKYDESSIRVYNINGQTQPFKLLKESGKNTIQIEKSRNIRNVFFLKLVDRNGQAITKKILN